MRLMRRGARACGGAGRGTSRTEAGGDQRGGCTPRGGVKSPALARSGRRPWGDQWATSCASAVRTVTVVAGPGTTAVLGIGAHSPPLMRKSPPKVVVTLAG